MNWQTFGEIGGFLIVAIGSVYSIAYARGKQDQLETVIKKNKEDGDKAIDGIRLACENKIADFRHELDKHWAWKDEHEKSADEKRREYDRELTTIKVTNATTAAQNIEILRRLESIEELLKKDIKNRKGEE